MADKGISNSSFPSFATDWRMALATDIARASWSCVPKAALRRKIDCAPVETIDAVHPINCPHARYARTGYQRIYTIDFMQSICGS